MSGLQQCCRSLHAFGMSIRSAKCSGITTYRQFSTSRALHLKEISIKNEGNKTVVEGVIVQSPRERKVLEVPEECSHLCPACPHRIGAEIQYTDVLILSQFLQPDGKMLSKAITGLCQPAHYRIKKCVDKAQLAGLLPGFKPDLTDGTEDTSAKSSKYRWARYNIYFEKDDWEKSN